MADKTRIFIFDDDPDILELCTMILTQKGYEVFTSLTCANLFDKIATVHPHVIFMDNWIPDDGGIVATHALKSHAVYRHIPVIYFSANNDIHLLAKQAGADSYLAKPFDIKELHHIIQQVLAAPTV